MLPTVLDPVSVEGKKKYPLSTEMPLHFVKESVVHIYVCVYFWALLFSHLSLHRYHTVLTNAVL